MIDSIFSHELSKLNKPIIIDIRNNNQYEKGHIPNSINIDFQKLLLYPNNYLRKDIKYYIYCQKGIQSTRLCSYLKKIGYSVINIQGGYDSWMSQNN